MTLVATAEETDLLNETVQIYARQALFYRSEPPTLTENYRVGKHLRFSSLTNPIEAIVYALPGVRARDTSLDWLVERAQRAG